MASPSNHVSSSASSESTTERRDLRRVVVGLIRHPQRVLVCLFVCWHVTFLLMRNMIDLTPDEAQEWCERQGIWDDLEALNKAQLICEKRSGIDQGWKMFGSPVARNSPYAAVKIEFDGETIESDDEKFAYQRSSNEQKDPAKYFRLGNWRIRKLEHFLVTKWEEWYANPKSKYGLLWKRFVHWRLDVWQKQHPNDPRKPVRLHLVTRRFTFPKPSEDPSQFDPPKIKVIASFKVEDKYRPFQKP